MPCFLCDGCSFQDEWAFVEMMLGVWDCFVVPVSGVASWLPSIFVVFCQSRCCGCCMIA